MVSYQPSLKYAHVEAERRFLLERLPPDWEPLPAVTIRDRYLLGTRLRLRTVEAAGEHTTWKLGQKIRFDPRSPQPVAHTTIYLDEAEAAVVAALPADEILKMRRTLVVDGHLWAVDEFSGRLAGLFLSEVDLGMEGSMTSVIPFPVAAEVSRDDRFSGRSLAQLSADDIVELIASVRP